MTQPWMKGERVVESCRRRFFRKMADDQRGHAGPTDAVTQQELDETDENADNCTCLTCMQNVNDDEKDLLPESREKVKWIRSNLSRKTGIRRKSGHECYACEKLRVRDHQGQTQKDIIDRMSRDRPFKDEYLTKRRLRVRGEDKYARKSKSASPAQVQEGEQEYDDQFDEGHAFF